MHKPKLWTKDFIIITFVQLFFALNFYLLMIIISVFATDKFDSSPSVAGLAASIFVLGSLFARFLTGRWIEQIGRKKTLYCGLLLGVVMTLLYFVANNIITLLVIRLLHGASFGIITTTAAIIVASIIPIERRGEGIGYFALSVTLATAIGPFLGMFLSQNGSYDVIFIASATAAALSFVITLFLSVPRMKSPEQQAEGNKGFKFSNFFESKVIPISIVIIVIYFCYSSVLSFLALYSKEIHLLDAASLFFVIYASAAFFSRPFVGRLFDSRGENLIMYSAIMFFIIGMVTLSQARHGYILLLSGALIALGFGSIQSVCQAITTKIAPPHRLGLATSTFFMFTDLGTGIGPFIFGLFIPFIGYSGIYIVAAIVALACVFLYYFLHGKKAMHANV